MESFDLDGQGYRLIAARTSSTTRVGVCATAASIARCTTGNGGTLLRAARGGSTGGGTTGRATGGATTTVAIKQEKEELK